MNGNGSLYLERPLRTRYQVNNTVAGTTVVCKRVDVFSILSKLSQTVKFPNLIFKGL